MSNDKSQKTEKPTQNKLRKIRKDGQVAKSKDLVSTFSMAVLLIYIGMAAKYMWAKLQLLFIHAAAAPAHDFEIERDAVINTAIETFVFISLPISIFAAIAAVLANISQIGFLFSLKPVMPDFTRLNPVSGFKRIFSSKNVIETVKAIFKIILLSTATFIVIMAFLDDIIKIIYCNIDCGIEVGKTVLFWILVTAIVIFIIVAIFDAWFQKNNFIKENMMTKDEVKKDRKITDGDPLIKSRMKAKAKELMNSDKTLAIKESTVVFMSENGHFVSLYYKKGETPLPILKVIEEPQNSQHMLLLANAFKIPVIEDSKISKYLLKKGKLNQYIPSDFISEIAAYMAPYINK